MYKWALLSPYYIWGSRNPVSMQQAGDSPSAWIPAIHAGDPVWVPEATEGIWGVKWMEAVSSFFPKRLRSLLIQLLNLTNASSPNLPAKTCAVNHYTSVPTSTFPTCPHLTYLAFQCSCLSCQLCLQYRPNANIPSSSDRMISLSACPLY